MVRYGKMDSTHTQRVPLLKYLPICAWMINMDVQTLLYASSSSITAGMGVHEELGIQRHFSS